MTQVSPAEIPQALEPVFTAGDPAAQGKAQERSNVEQFGRMMSEGRLAGFRAAASEVARPAGTWPARR